VNKFVLMCGYIGATLLALCALPEVYITVTTGETALSWAFLLMWFVGEVTALIYIIGKMKEVDLLPLLFNYGVNTICLMILLWYKIGV